MKLKKSVTDRGLRLLEFSDAYQRKCSLQASSNTAFPCVWLGVAPEEESSRMHLSQDHVKALLPALKKFAETGELP